MSFSSEYIKNDRFNASALQTEAERFLPVELSRLHVTQAVWVGAGQQQDVSLKKTITTCQSEENNNNKRMSAWRKQQQDVRRKQQQDTQSSQNQSNIIRYILLKEIAFLFWNKLQLVDQSKNT